MRGKKKALLVPLTATRPGDVRSHEAFGMWKDRTDLGEVRNYVRKLRRGRYRDL